MIEKRPIFPKMPIFIGSFAVFALAMMFFGGRAAAQAGAGPLPGAAPSDQPVPQAATRLPAQVGGHPSLAGTWTLNKDQSDDPREKMREAMGNSGGQGGGNGGGMGGGGRRGGGMGGGRGQGRGEGGETNELSQLTIEQTASSAKVTGSSGRVLALYSSTDTPKSDSSTSTSGTSNNSGNSENENAPAVAQWQDSQLVATMQGRRGGSTRRTYQLSPDGKQLYVITKIDNPRFQQPVTYRLVYDPSGTSQ